jgi:hypothetical protein
MKILRLLPIFLLLSSTSLFAQSSLQFDGADDYVEIDSTLEFRFLENLTYSMWVNSEWDGSNYLVDITDNPADYNNAGFRTFIGTFGGFGGSSFYFSQYMNGDQRSNVFNITFKSNEWAHIACVAEKVGEIGDSHFYELRTYVNAVLQDSDTLEVESRNRVDRLLTLTPGGQKVLGARFNIQANRFLDGNMDDFSLHARVLTETEIQNIVCTGVTPNDNNTIIFYDFNAGSGFTSTDRTGNGYNGINHGPTFNNSTFPDLNNATPVADFDPNTTLQSLWANFDNTSVGYDIGFWTWDDGEFDTTSSNSVWHRFPESGTYNVCLDAIATCGNSDQFCEDVNIVCDLPVATFVKIGNELVLSLNADDSGVDSVYWDFGDGDSDDGNNFTLFHTYPSKGLYTICLYAYNNCGVDTMCAEYNAVIQNVAELQMGGFKVFPNPVEDVIKLEVSDEPGHFDVSLYDLSGRMVFKQINNRGSSVMIERPGISAGEYIIEVDRNGVKHYQKLLLQ